MTVHGQGLAGLLAESSRRRVEAPIDLDLIDLTGPQSEYVDADDPELLWRDGNQIGKSFGLAYLIIQFARGRLRWQTRRGPFKILVISVSYEQIVPLMEKIWELLPKGEIAESVGFEPGRGFTGKPPRIVFRSGPGRGSEIVFGTYRQGANRIAGGTFDLVIMDEPPTESMYGEVRPRVLRRKGLIRVCMTPTPNMPPVDWYRERVEAGIVRELNYGLTESACRPRGYPAPFLYQEEIDAYASSLLDVEREQRIRGAWTALVTGRWLRDFSDDNVRAIDLRDLAGWTIGIGIDHGTVGRKQCAVLVASTGGGTPRPRVAVIDEEVSDGPTTPEHDAASVLDMIRRNGLLYDSIDFWVGDVATGSKRWEVRKSNADLRREIAANLGRRDRDVKMIYPPKKFTGSVFLGLRMMNALAARRLDARGVPVPIRDLARGAKGTPCLIVDPRCVGFRKACETFAGDDRDPVKDVLDGGRYAIERSVDPRAFLPVLHARY